MADFRQRIMLNILMLFRAVAKVTQVLRRLGRILALTGQPFGPLRTVSV
jgi:hypothetical protein